MSNILLLPGDPGFTETLLQPPPGWQEVAAKEDDYGFVYDSQTHLLRPVTPTDLIEYCYGGEYDFVEECHQFNEEATDQITTLPTFEELTGMKEEEFFFSNENF